MKFSERDDSDNAAKKYFKKARQMFPELVASGYLGWLWRETFGGGK